MVVVPFRLAVIDVAPVTEWMEQERQRKKHEQFLREREAREKMKADRCKELEYQKSGHNQQILFNTGQVNAGFRKMEAAEGAEIKEKFVIKKRSKNTVGAGAAAGVSAGAAAAGTVSSSSAEAGKGMSGNVGAAPDETPPPRPPAPP